MNEFGVSYTLVEIRPENSPLAAANVVRRLLLLGL
jgi:hypothetical protein